MREDAALSEELCSELWMPKRRSPLQGGEEGEKRKERKQREGRHSEWHHAWAALNQVPFTRPLSNAILNISLALKSQSCHLVGVPYKHNYYSNASLMSHPHPGSWSAPAGRRLHLSPGFPGSKNIFKVNALGSVHYKKRNYMWVLSNVPLRFQLVCNALINNSSGQTG